MESSPAETFAQHCRAGELAFQVTPDGEAVFYPRVAAPGSGAELQWRVSAGIGTVHATTVCRPRGGDPYNVALVDLDEGFRMMSRVESVAPEDVRIGMRVAVRFVEREDGAPLPVFDPLEGR